MVSKAVIDALVTAAVRWSDETPGGTSYHWHYGARRIDPGTATAIGQMLWHANWYRAEGAAKGLVEGVPDEPVYEYQPLPGVPAPLVVLRLIEDYVYQTADEPEEWRPSEAFGFVHALRGEAIRRLPGYRDLPSTIGEQDRDVYLRLGGPEPEVEPLPVDADDPEWVELNALLAGTGVPFEAMSPRERRRRAEHLTGPMLRGHWSARWPEATFATVVSLHGTEQDAVAGFDSSVRRAREHSSPRYAFEVLRRGRTVVFLTIDHGNPAADDWLDRVRDVFADADARQDVPSRAPGELPGS